MARFKDVIRPADQTSGEFKIIIQGQELTGRINLRALRLICDECQCSLGEIQSAIQSGRLSDLRWVAAFLYACLREGEFKDDKTFSLPDLERALQISELQGYSDSISAAFQTTFFAGAKQPEGNASRPLDGAANNG